MRRARAVRIWRPMASASRSPHGARESGRVADRHWPRPAEPLTFDASDDGHPVWSPDGSRVVFRSLRNGPWDLFGKAASGAGDERPLLVTANQVAASLVARWQRPALRDPVSEDRAGPLGPAVVGDRKPFPVVQTPSTRPQGNSPLTGDGWRISRTNPRQCRFTSARFPGLAARGRCR